MKMRGDIRDSEIDKAFYAARVPTTATSSQKRETPEQRKKRVQEIEDLKKSTECFNCGEVGHWSKECNKPKKEKKNFKGKGQANATTEVIESDAFTVNDSFSGGFPSELQHDLYLDLSNIMIDELQDYTDCHQETFSSEAYLVKTTDDEWIADSVASLQLST